MATIEQKLENLKKLGFKGDLTEIEKFYSGKFFNPKDKNYQKLLETSQKLCEEFSAINGKTGINATKEERWVMGKKTGCDLISLDSLVFGDKEGNVRTYYGTSTIFQKFIKSHGLSGYGLHLHGLRQTFSNILFENNVKPKVIQMLLGHKDVKTTIMNYNSVDQTYFAKTSNIINNSL